MRHTDNTLFLVSGPSGSGKSSIFNEVLTNQVISTTTRSPRPGEIDGRDYYFRDYPYFNKMLKKHAFFEHSPYNGQEKDSVHLYGVTNEEFFNKIEKGPAFDVVNFDGQQTFIKLYPKCVSVFIYTSKDSVIQQMQDRGDSKLAIENRILTYEKELVNKSHYDHVIRNKYGYFEDIVEAVRRIVKIES